MQEFTEAGRIDDDETEQRGFEEGEGCGKVCEVMV